MAKKTLNEAVVRRFQRLANLTPMNEMYMKEEGEEEEADAMMGDDTEMPVDDVDPEMGAEEAPVDVDLTDEEANILIELGQKLEAAMGGMEGEEEEMDADEMAGDEAAADPMNPEDELMEALRGISYNPSKNEVVNEVAKRVAKRLKTAKLHEAKLNRALGRK